MDFPPLKLKLDPLTQAVIEDARTRLVDAGLVERALDVREQNVGAIKAIVIGSTALPLHARATILLRFPIRRWRIRRALRPLRTRIRAELALPDPTKPWIEDHEAFRILLHGF